MSFLKHRSLPPRTSFGDAGRKAASANRSERRGPVVGEYDSWWPLLDKALWVALCPTQAWSYDLYNRETGTVDTFENQYWYASVEHRVQMGKGQFAPRFTCSAGAHKDKPCWGCGVRRVFYERIDQEAERTGVRRKGESPISAMTQFSMSMVLLEDITKVPVMKDGKIRTDRGGKPIYRDVPLATLELKDQKKARSEGNVVFGKSVHWSTGVKGINELLALDEQLGCACANCAEDLTAVNFGCPECGDHVQIAQDPDEPLRGEDLLTAKREDYSCPTCGYTGRFTPLYDCTKCGEPEEGGLVHFGLRLKNVEVGEKQRVLTLAEYRPIGSFVEKHPNIEEMLMSPLNIPEIFRPTSIQYQLKLVPERMRGDGVTPDARRKEKPDAKSYDFSGDDDSSNDEE